MTSQGKATGIVGDDVQAAVDAKHHLIVAHEVPNVQSHGAGCTRGHGQDQPKAAADRGYYNAPQIKACHDAASPTVLPKPMTSNAKAEGRFDKADFVYIARDDKYQCPAGQRAIYRFSREENGLPATALLEQCLPSLPDEAADASQAYRKPGGSERR